MFDARSFAAAALAFASAPSAAQKLSSQVAEGKKSEPWRNIGASHA